MIVGCESLTNCFDTKVIGESGCLLIFWNISIIIIHLIFIVFSVSCKYIDAIECVDRWGLVCR